MRIWQAAVLATALFVAACFPTTRHSIGTTAGIGADPDLVGTWIGEMDEEGDIAYLHFLRLPEDGLGVLMIKPSAPDDGGGWGYYTVTTAEIAGHRFMNAHWVISDGKVEDEAPADPTPLYYNLAGDGELRLWLMDRDATIAAINEGKIAGEVEEGAFGDVRITAEPDALDNFMASAEGRALFTVPFGKYRRAQVVPE